jgi:hypothetical protein
MTQQKSVLSRHDRIVDRGDGQPKYCSALEITTLVAFEHVIIPNLELGPAKK